MNPSILPINIVLPDGSMQEVVSGLLAKAGLPIIVGKKRVKEGRIAVPWIDRVAFQRPQEIPHYLNAGHFDLAIVGEDWIANWGYDFPVLLKLAIGRGGNKAVKIVLAVRESSGFSTVADLPKGCDVATEYVQLVNRFFAGLDRTDIRVIPSCGNTEHKVHFGATGVVDVTESGESLRENRLYVIHQIMESHTVVVANPSSFADDFKRPYLDCFARLLKGASEASRYVLLTANVPEKVLDDAARIIGGLKGPSRSPLTTAGWFALQSVVPREKEHEVIFGLLQIGVTDIIVNREIPMIMS